MRSCILIPEYLQETETTETVTDYIGEKNPSITISDLTKITQSQANNIINNNAVTGLSNGNYSVTYTFSDTISINSLNFITGASGMSELPVQAISIEAYNNGSWTTIISGSYDGDYTYNTNETLFASNSIFTNKIRLNFTGWTYSGGGLTYYASFHRFELNADVKKVIQAGLVPQPHMIDTPKYLKRIVTETSWTQPVATSNNTAIAGGNMVFTASSEGDGKMYGAMDGNISGSSSSNFWQTTSNTPLGWWQVKFPYKIRITGLKFYNCYSNYTNHTKTARFYTNSSKAIPIGDAFTGVNSNYGLTTITGIPAEGIITDTIYLDITECYRTSSGMGELQITATKLTEAWQAGTENDYNLIIPQKHTINVQKYLKKIITETPFVQPTLSANGTIGGDSFAVDSSSSSGTNGLAFYAFNGIVNDNRYADSANGATFYWISWYNPIPLKIASLKIDNSPYSGATAPTGGIVQGSNDNSNWEDIVTFTNSVTAINQSWTITVNSSKSYKYHRIYVPSSNFTGGTKRARFAEITISATEYTEVWQQGTPQDYDIIM